MCDDSCTLGSSWALARGLLSSTATLASPAAPCTRAQAKLRIARAVFDRCGAADLESEGFRRFCADAWEWLQVRGGQHVCGAQDLVRTGQPRDACTPATTALH